MAPVSALAWRSPSGVSGRPRLCASRAPLLRGLAAPGVRAAAASGASPSPAMVVGIDFGTHGSGFAYSRLAQAQDKEQPRLRMHDAWPGQPDRIRDVKTKTAILYRGSTVEDWGWTAWDRWSKMTPAEQAGCHYLENFKLQLLDPEQREQLLRGPGGTALSSSLPPGVNAVQVVADYLSLLRSYVFRHLTPPAGAGVAPLDPASIVWCLTIPAMWSEAAKNRMKQAANRAGMVCDSNPASLLLTLEPEAAVLAAVVMQDGRPTHPEVLPPPPAAGGGARGSGAAAGAEPDAAAALKLREVSAPGGTGGGAAKGGRKAVLSEGDVVLVLDCGGGTADVTLHRIHRGRGNMLQLEEAAAGNGVLAGCTFVDQALWRHVRAVVGAGAWDAWRAQHADEWPWLSGKWEMLKRKGGAVSLQLPPGLMGKYLQSKKAAGGSGNGNGSQAASGLGPNGVLVLSEEVLKRSIFGPVVEQVVAAAAGVLDAGASGGSTCNKILLAGGFANSHYLQQRVKQLAAERGAQLVMPAFPAAAVVAGAVIFGQQPSSVSARRSRVTYGIACRALWTSEDAASQAKHGYPDKVWRLEDSTFNADGVFQPYVRRNQLVKTDEVVRRTFCPTTTDTKAISIELFASESDSEPRYVAEPGLRKKADMVLQLPPDWSTKVLRRACYEVEVEMRFGSTEITLAAKDLHSNAVVETKINWAADQLP